VTLSLPDVDGRDLVADAQGLVAGHDVVGDIDVSLVLQRRRVGMTQRGGVRLQVQYRLFHHLPAEVKLDKVSYVQLR